MGEYSIVQSTGVVAFALTVSLWGSVSRAEVPRIIADTDRPFSSIDQREGRRAMNNSSCRAKGDTLGLALGLRAAFERLEAGRKKFDSSHSGVFSAIHHVFLERRAGSSSSLLIYQVEQRSNEESRLAWYEQIVDSCTAQALGSEPRLLSSWTQEWDGQPDKAQSVILSGFHRLFGFDVFQLTSLTRAEEPQEESEGSREQTIGVLWNEHLELAVYFNNYDTLLAVQGDESVEPQALVEMFGFANGLGVQHLVRRTETGLALQMLVSDCGVADDLSDWSVYGEVPLQVSSEIQVSLFEMTEQSIAVEAFGIE